MADYSARSSSFPWFLFLTSEEVKLIEALETRALGRFHEEEAKRAFKALKASLGADPRLALTIGTLDKKETRKTKAAKSKEPSGVERTVGTSSESITPVSVTESPIETFKTISTPVEFTISPVDAPSPKTIPTKRRNTDALFRKDNPKKTYQGPQSNLHSEDPNLFTTK